MESQCLEDVASPRESGEGEALTRKGGKELLMLRLTVEVWGPSQGEPPGWRLGGALKLSEGRAHSQSLWVHQTRGLVKVHQGNERRAGQASHGLPRACAATGVPLGSFEKSAWLLRVIGTEGCLWKASSLLSAALKVESSDTICVKEEAKRHPNVTRGSTAEGGLCPSFPPS